MKDLINFERIWEWCKDKWVTSFATVLLMVVAFFAGMAVKEKFITDDCRFVGAFRDGSQPYTCQPRVR